MKSSNSSTLILDGHTPFERKVYNMKLIFGSCTPPLWTCYAKFGQGSFGVLLLLSIASSFGAVICHILQKDYRELLEIDLDSGKVYLVRFLRKLVVSKKPIAAISDILSVDLIQSDLPAKSKHPAMQLQFECVLNLGDKRQIAVQLPVDRGQLPNLYNTAKSIASTLGSNLNSIKDDFGNPMDSLESIEKYAAVHHDLVKNMDAQDAAASQFFSVTLIVVLFLATVLILVN